MPTEQEYINYKDFVDSLDEATPTANDKAVFNDANGPKGSVFSAIATFVHDTFAAFVNALTAKTSFASGDKIPVVNGSTATAMEASKLLELTAQNALAGNVAPSFEPNRTSDNPYKANTPILYNGKLYFFKVDHYGAWDVSDVYSIPLTEKYLDEVFLEFEYKRGYHRVDLEYVGDFVEDATYYTVKTGARVGDKFFITGQGAAAAQLWATYDKDGKIVRRAGGTNTYKLYEDFFVVTIEDGEAGIVFNSHFFIGRFTFRLLNLSSIVSRLNEETKMLIEHDKLIFEYRLIGKYKASAGSPITSFLYTAPASEFSVKLTKVSGPATYDIWMNDSTGVLSNVQYKTNLSFDSIVDVAMVEGYDRIFFFAQGVPGVAVDVTAYRVLKDSIEYKVNSIETKVDSLEDDNSLIFEYEFIRRYTATAGSGIVGWYYRAPASEFSVKLTKVSGPATYDIWMNDSTGVLSNVQYKTNLSFDSIVDVAMVEGYDRIFFFAQGVPGVAVDVTAYRVFKNTLEYRIESLEGASSFRGKKIVCLGDSITQFKYNGISYCDYLQNLTGANVVNGGVGGTRYAVRTTPTTTPTTASEAWAGVDMYNLVKSWCDNDWDIVDASAEWLYEHDGGRDISPIINRLKNNPVSSADVVTLFSGTNDWVGGTSKGAVNDGDSSSLLGAISLIIEMLLAANPKLKIFVFTPVVRWIDYTGMATSDPSKFSDVRTESGRTLKELAGWIAEGVQLLHIPVCDLYNALGWNQYNFSAYFLDTDGTHPYKGFSSLAKRMNGFLIANNW